MPYYASSATVFNVTVIVLLPDVARLLTTFAYICAAGVPSLFHPRTAGVIKKVVDPLAVVLTSVRTPDPGAGSVPSDLPLSADLVAVSTYKITYAGELMVTLRSENDLPDVGIVIFADEFCDIDPVVVLVFALDPKPVAQLRFPEPSVFKNCPLTILLGKVSV